LCWLVEVRVAIDQAGKDRRRLQVDHRIAGCGFDETRLDRTDAFAFHNDGYILPHRILRAVDECAGVNENAGACGDR
jgi:hypothetical protein